MVGTDVAMVCDDNGDGTFSCSPAEFDVSINLQYLSYNELDNSSNDCLDDYIVQGYLLLPN